jgi:NNP family nitrate/nitrite transporter-like MFS transporter
MMNLTPIQVGLLVSIPNLSGSLLRIPFSAMVDTQGGRKPFIILLILSIIGLLGLNIIIGSSKPNRIDETLFPILILLGVLSGSGIATFSVGISQTSYWYPQDQQGTALGIYAGLGNLAPGLFTLLFPYALAFFGFQGVYLVYLVFLIFGSIIYYQIGLDGCYFQLLRQGIKKDEAINISVVECQRDVFPENSLYESLIYSAKSWRTWALVFVYFTTFGGFLALTVWLPNYGQRLYGLNLLTATKMAALYSILASVTRVLGGKISDKSGGVESLSLSLIIVLFGSLVMVFSRTLIISIIGVVILAIGMGIANAAVFKIIPQISLRAIGGSAGWIGGIGALGGFIIPLIMASFIRAKDDFNRGYASGFIIFIFLSIVSLVLINKIRVDRSG